MKAPAIGLATVEALRESVGAEFASAPVGAFLVEAPGTLAQLRTMDGVRRARAVAVLAELAHA